jgi:hypothetical protein
MTGYKQAAAVELSSAKAMVGVKGWSEGVRPSVFPMWSGGVGVEDGEGVCWGG